MASGEDRWGVQDLTVIPEGLNAGERVIVNGQLRVAPNAKVVVQSTVPGAQTNSAASGRLAEAACEYLRALHQAAHHDHAGHGRHFDLRHLRLPLLPVSDLPNVDFPTIQVSASLPGASPETMASSVATPLEKQFSTIAGIDSMTSTNSLGQTSITIQFNLSRSLDGAALDVQSAITAAGGQLPPEMPTPPSFQKVNPADPPILYLALSSPTMKLPTWTKPPKPPWRRTSRW